jgi:hypothetical protein
VPLQDVRKIMILASSKLQDKAFLHNIPDPYSGGTSAYDYEWLDPCLDTYPKHPEYDYSSLDVCAV